MPPAAVRKYFDDARVGNARRAMAQADALAVRCSADPATRRHTPAIVLVHGQLLAADEQLGAAAVYLEQGLAMLADTGPHEVVGGGDAQRALLVSLLVQLGRYEAAAAHLPVMEDPARPIEARFAALRARAQLATIHGQPELGHQVLNTAASVAQRIKGAFPIAMIDADRANLLATQGRLFEAMALADHLFLRTVRPVRGPHGDWSSALTTSVAFTLSRHAADQGRAYDCERFLVVGISAVERSPSTFGVAHMELAMARAWRRRGDFAHAEEALIKAAGDFARLGCAPSSALVTLEEACLAEARNLGTSTRSLFERALASFDELGHAWESAILRRHLGLVDPRAVAAAATSREPSPTEMRSSRRDRMPG